MTDAIAELPALEQFQKWTDLMGRGQQMMLEFATKEGEGGMPNPDPLGLIGTWQKATAAALADPQKLFEQQTRFMRDAMKLWQSFLGGEAAASPVAPIKDKRFASPAWAETPAFDFLRQSYLLASNYVLEATASLDGLDAHEKAKAQFHAKQFVDALSPSNFALTNPDVLNEDG